MLIVDDEPAILRTLKRALDGDDVEQTTRATEAFSRITAGERFDVILSRRASSARW